MKCQGFWGFGVVDEGGTKIDDLDLVELLVLFKEDVLGLEITMDNVGLVAIVDAGKDLLHENGTVALAEFSTLQNLIEELTAFADPKLSEKVRVSKGCHRERRV